MWGTVVKSLLGIGCFKLCCNDKLNKSYVILVFGQVSNVDNVEQQPLQKKLKMRRNWKWQNTNCISEYISSFTYFSLLREVCLFALTLSGTKCLDWRIPPLTSPRRQKKYVEADARRRTLAMLGAGTRGQRCVFYLKLNQKKRCQVLYLEKKIVKVTLFIWFLFAQLISSYVLF